MNIYLDIDGVLIANEMYAALHAPEFIKYVLTNYPDSTYWLTTHCQGNPNQPVQYVADLFDEETIELLKKIKPTIWSDPENKTDAIDFTQPFLWFDDDLFEKEKQALEKHGVLENWIQVDLHENPDQLGKFLQSFPIPIEDVKTNE